MRSLPAYILTALILYILCGSCHKEQSPIPELLCADSLMETNPDSSLGILRTIDTAAIPSPADRALYTLLLTQAEYKTGADMTDPTAIQTAVNYYSSHPESDRLMLSLYYLGVIQCGDGQYDEAIISLLEAEHLASSQENWFYLGLIDRQISIVYDNVYSASMSLLYSQRAVDAFYRSGNREYWNYERCNLAGSYIASGDAHKAIAILDSVKTIAITMDDTLTIAESLSKKAYALLNLKDWHGAIETLKDVENFGLTFNNAKDRQAMILAYQQMGDRQKADSIYNLLDTLQTPIYVSLHNFYADKGDFCKAYDALKKGNCKQDSMIWAMMRQKVTASSYTYDNLLLNQASLKAKNQRLIFSLVIIISLFAVTLIISYIIYRKKILDKRLNALLKDYDILSYKLRKLSSENKEPVSDTPKWTELFKKQFSTLDKLCSEYYNTPSAKKTTKFAKQIESTIFSLKGDTKFIDSIFDDLNLYHYNIITELKEAASHPSLLTQSDYTLLALLSTGLSYQAISIILSVNIEPLYVRKSRLKAKISRLDFNRKEELIDLVFSR